MKNNILILGIILIAAYSCNNQTVKSNNDQIPLDYIEHKINLKNYLGVLTLCLPPEFDTTYFWTNYSDYYCGDVEMYRIANKEYSLLQETGMFQKAFPDSLYQVTIEHSKNIGCDDTIEIDAQLLEHMIERYISIDPSNMEIFIKELKNINGKKYMVIGSRLHKETRLDMMTEIYGHWISICFIYQGDKYYTDFINRIRKSLKTIKITLENDSPIVEAIGEKI